MIKVDISGLDSLARDLSKAPKAAKSAAEAKGASAAERIVSGMRARVPVRDGNLQGSIRAEPARDGGTLIRAGGTAETMKQSASGSFDEALSVEYGNVHSSPQPFFHNTIEDHRRGVETEMGEAADDAAGKAVP